ncbi:putative mitochondrial protein [Dendrobium catenatum]|uniref:Putative mitochondrial protein n=1 Tax=Dendrobium catenatum TaxID=906689 RepID=A0A2I0VT70_9ASPA|nr:putative mitochondrial protein [Dendrobium catenatum]
MDSIFGAISDFTCVYIDDVLVFSHTKDEHLAHLHFILSKFESHGLIISKKKMTLCVQHIEFLGSEIGKGKIKLQPHISKKILEMPDKLEDIKLLRTFLGLLNYARPFIKDLSKYTKPLYNKTSLKGTRTFNREDVLLVQKIKDLVSKLPELTLPVDSDYLIIESDGCEQGWGGTLIRKPNKFYNKSEERICRYASGIYKEKAYLLLLTLKFLL